MLPHTFQKEEKTKALTVVVHIICLIIRVSLIVTSNSDFFYNYLNNSNFNNKRNKIKILRIQMAVARCKDTTVSDVFPFFFLLFSYFKKKNYQRQWEWHFSIGVATK
jgi:hypothetical protein